MANITLTAEDIFAKVEDGTATPYMVYVVLRDRMAGSGNAKAVDRVATLKPQMMYNYDRNGLIVKGRAAKVTGHAGRYTRNEINEFVGKFMAKNFGIEEPKELVLDAETIDELNAEIDF
jgi:tRNA(Ile2) C34 agmatinyltransferase TiaS